MMRIWVDKTVAACVPEWTLDDLIKDGFTLVLANAAIDVKYFQKHPDWVASQLESGRIVVEYELALDETVAKPFYWSSCGVTTPACSSLKEAAGYLPNPDEVIKLAGILDTYSLKKGEWKTGSWAPPTPLSPEFAEKLEVAIDATRTDILKAAQEKDLMDDYDYYNLRYCRGSAQHHRCSAMLSSHGTLLGIIG